MKCVVLNVCFKADDKGSGQSPIPYRQQVIRALVQRYIESARREFEETKRKGNWDSDTNLHYKSCWLTNLTCCMLHLFSLPSFSSFSTSEGSFANV